MTTSPSGYGCSSDNSSSAGLNKAGSCIGVRLAGTGMGIPEKELTNADLAKMVDTSDEWITQRTGIKTRRIAEEGVTARHLGARALKMALENAGMSPKQLDLVIVATITPEMICPSTAAQIVADVGAIPAAAFDLNAACSGFVYALTTGANFIKCGQYKTVAVIGTETLARLADWKDRRTCILFGDGAGAVILTASEDATQGSLFASLHSDGSMWQELYCPRGPGDVPPGDKIFSGAYNTLQMNGQAIFKFAVSTLQKCIDEALAAKGLRAEDLAGIVSHQSNYRILESARERLGLSPEKLYINIDRYGNTSSASIPIAFHELTAGGKFKKGDLVLFVGLGGGLTWAANLWRL